jgi:hypothetical protein
MHKPWLYRQAGNRLGRRRKKYFRYQPDQGTNPIGEHLVSMRNHKNFQGVLREISEVMSNPPRKIKSYNWLELNRQLVYKDD